MNHFTWTFLYWIVWATSTGTHELQGTDVTALNALLVVGRWSMEGKVFNPLNIHNKYQNTSRLPIGSLSTAQLQGAEREVKGAPTACLNHLQPGIQLLDTVLKGVGNPNFGAQYEPDWTKFAKSQRKIPELSMATYWHIQTTGYLLGYIETCLMGIRLRTAHSAPL